MKAILILLLIGISTPVFAQSTRRIVKDFDGDHKKDTVYIDSDSAQLFCSLSTNKYKKVASERIRILNFGNTLVSIPGGFEFWNDYGRSGFINEFRYNAKAKKMQLVEIRRTDYAISYSEYGNQVRGGSGKSSINLVTHKYTGNFYDVHNGKLRKLPTINSEMIFPETFLNTFSDAIYYDFERKCVALYEKRKKETK